MATKINYNQLKGAPVNVLDYGANTIPGTTDMTTAVQAAITAAQTLGQKLVIVEEFAISSQLNITSKLYMEFTAGGKLTALAGFTPVTHTGGGDIATVAWMLYVNGVATADTVIVNPNLDGSTIAGGISINDTNHVRVSGGLIENMNANGTYITAGDNCTVENVSYTLCGVDATDTGSTYTTTLRNDTGEGAMFTGNRVTFSGGKGIALSTCSYGIVSNNYVKDCTKPYGACYYAAVAVSCKFIGNIGVQGVDTANSSEVCKLSIACNHVSFENNWLYQHDDSVDILRVQDNDYTFVTGNVLFKLTGTTGYAIRDVTDQPPHIAPYAGAKHLTISGNFLHSVNGGTAILLIAPEGGAEDSGQSVIGNSFYGWTLGVEANVINGSIKANNFVNCTLDYLFGASAGLGTSGDYPKIVYTLYSDTATTTTAETFIGYVMPANRLDRTNMLRVKVVGTKTGGAGNKTIKFRFGVTDITFNAAANDTNDWMVDALVMNTLVSGLYIVQRINVVGYNGTTIVQDYVITGNNTNDTATALNVGVAATAATGPDVITVTMMTVELLYTQYT